MPDPRTPFPATRHSIIDRLRESDDEARSVAFDTLTHAYWRPVRDYLRIQWHLSVEDAEDLTQSFFARALTNRVFERFDAQKARFRTFLRVCVDRYAANASRRDRPESDELFDDQLAAEQGHSEADQVMRDAWLSWFFRRVTERLEAELTRDGRETHFALFKAYDLGRLVNETPPTYAALAERFSLPVTQVTNFLALARREFRRLVLAELAETTASDADYRQELHELLGGAP